MSENYDFEYGLALKASWYYYVENMTQQNISDIMGISRMRVIKLLEHARQKGIIQFHFRSEHSYRMELECRLMKRWGLQDVFIVPVDNTIKNLDLSVGKAAAMYLYNQIHEDCYINWGHGRTLNYTLGNLYRQSDRRRGLLFPGFTSCLQQCKYACHSRSPDYVEPRGHPGNPQRTSCPGYFQYDLALFHDSSRCRQYECRGHSDQKGRYVFQ